MSERGVFAVDRGVFDHPAFAAEPYTEREAWLWLIGSAAWRQKQVRIGRHTVTLARGQFAFSERFLASKWKWSKSKVHRFIIRLKIEAMIEPLADQEVNHITICNYDKYAFDGTTREPQTEPQSGPVADQSRTKEEEREESKKVEKKEPLRGASAPAGQVTEKDLYDFGRKVLGKAAGGLVTQLRQQQNHDLAAAFDILQQATEKSDPLAWINGVLRRTEKTRTPNHLLFPPDIYRGVL